MNLLLRVYLCSVRRVFNQVLSRNQIAIWWFTSNRLGNTEVQTNIVVNVYRLRWVSVVLCCMRKTGFIPEALALWSTVNDGLGRLVLTRWLLLPGMIIVFNLIDKIR